MTDYTLRGHHLYQLYKAYQIRQRGIKRVWDSFVWNSLLGGLFSSFHVDDRTFGDSPKQVKSIKKALSKILSDKEARISFVDQAQADKDYLCAHCPEKCSPDYVFKPVDALVLEMAGVVTEKEYSLNDLKIKAFSNEEWTKRYENMYSNMLRYGPFGNSWESLLEEERWWKRSKARSIEDKVDEALQMIPEIKPHLDSHKATSFSIGSPVRIMEEPVDIQTLSTENYEIVAAKMHHLETSRCKAIERGWINVFYQKKGSHKVQRLSTPQICLANPFDPGGENTFLQEFRYVGLYGLPQDKIRVYWDNKYRAGSCREYYDIDLNLGEFIKK